MGTIYMDELSIQVTEIKNQTIIENNEEEVIIEFNSPSVLEINSQSEIELTSITEQGLPGASAYEIAIANGFVGTEEEWLNSLSVDNFFTYSQILASNEWTITHNLNKFPSVTIVDSSGDVVFGNIKYIDNNNLIVSFSAPFSGMAYLN